MSHRRPSRSSKRGTSRKLAGRASAFPAAEKRWALNALSALEKDQEFKLTYCYTFPEDFPEDFTKICQLHGIKDCVEEKWLRLRLGQIVYIYRDRFKDEKSYLRQVEECIAQLEAAGELSSQFSSTFAG